jgi:cysteine synthase
MNPFDLSCEIVDRDTYGRAVAHMRSAKVRLPSFAQLADAPEELSGFAPGLAGLDPDQLDARNLFRVHWFNDDSRKGLADTPAYLRMPRELTGIDAEILVVLGDRFPMIGAHKVLAAYGCLVPRLVTGRFDPKGHRAIWPSTGNYCRGGIAISRLMGCRGVAVLPEGMSAERFRWLESWASDPADIVRTPGTESNVKEIYDECARLSEDPNNDIINQFSEFANYLVHREVTARALERVFEAATLGQPRKRLAAFVAASGSAGTLGAGDALKARHAARIVVVEPLECPTLLCNGYGEHNIQGIGDKHVPLIHNVMNTDLVVGVSDRDCDGLFALFNSDAGKRFLIERKNAAPEMLAKFVGLGLSGIANILGAIKTAKRLQLSSDDVLITVATDGAPMYYTEMEKWLTANAPDGLDQVHAAELYGTHLKSQRDDNVLELTEVDRRRIFNLGYYTWVEQQGISVADFDRRRDQQFWRDLVDLVPVWDDLIARFNRETGLEGSA